MPQTEVNYHSRRYYYGMVWSGTYNIIRGTQGELVNGEKEKIIKWGYGVIQEPETIPVGTPPPGSPPPQATPGNPRKIVYATKSDQAFAGVAIINESWGISEEAMIANKGRGFKPNTPIDLLSWGDVVVPIEKAIAVPVVVRYGEPVSMRCVEEGEQESGVFSNVEDDKHILIPNARWLQVFKQPTDTELGAGVVNFGKF